MDISLRSDGWKFASDQLDAHFGIFTSAQYVGSRLILTYLHCHMYTLRRSDVMYRDILLAYDGSRDSREALAQGARLAHICNARVLLLAVAPPERSVLPVEGMSLIVEYERRKILADLHEGLSVLQAQGLTCDIRLCVGNPAEQIVAVAHEIKADLIVVGHRNRSALARWWNGSIGASILDCAPCSLLIAVKTPIKLAAARESMKRKQAQQPPAHHPVN